MANNLNTMRRRNLGFAGMEGELLNEQAAPRNALASLITNESIARMQPQNYMQRTGGPRIDLGPSRPDVMPPQTRFRQPSGSDLMQQAILAQRSPQQAAMDAQRFLQANPDMANEQGFSQEELSAQMGDNTFSNILEQRSKDAYAREAAMAKQAMSPADVLAREKFEWEKSQGKPQDKTQGERVQTANDALDIIAQAKDIFKQGKATQSLIGKAADFTAGAFGSSTEGARAAAQLKALGGALVSKMPKMSGPQSDKDVQLYREMAGQIADETVPLETRAAALSTVEALQRKYAGMQDAAPAEATNAKSAPKTGYVQDGYMFLGGDPSDPKRWKEQ
jgi:hypothetical protein